LGELRTEIEDEDAFFGNAATGAGWQRHGESFRGPLPRVRRKPPKNEKSRLEAGVV
jgi:hypothetical protein